MKSLNNKKILMSSHKIAKAIEAEVEEILEHAELAAKEFIPARYVKSALSKIESKLELEGIEAVFNKAVSRTALRKTASEEVNKEELEEVVSALVDAIIAEVEEVLEDTDTVADETVSTMSDESTFEVESKLKTLLENKLAAKGIYAKLERKHKPSILAQMKNKK